MSPSPETMQQYIVPILDEARFVRMSRDDLKQASYIACRYGLEEIVHKLLVHRPECILFLDETWIDQYDLVGDTPIMDAIARGHLGVVKLFYEFVGVDRIHDELYNGRGYKLFPLMTALSTGQDDILWYLLHEFPEHYHISGDDKRGYWGDHYIHHAAIRGCVKLIRYFEHQGADMSRLGWKGESPLLMAAESGHVEALQIFLPYNDIYSTNMDDRNVLHYARDGDMVDYLVTMFGLYDHVNHKDKNGDTPLHTTCMRLPCSLDSIDRFAETKIESLIRHGADVNIKNKKGLTPLHIVAVDHLTPRVAELLAAKTNDDDVLSCLLWVPYKYTQTPKLTTLTKILLRHGNTAPEWFKLETCSTALDLAITNGKIGAARELLHFLQDERIDNPSFQEAGVTGLHFAAEIGSVKAVENILKWHIADVNTMTAGGNTPLHYAVQGGHVDVVKRLLEKQDINVDVMNCNGTTPLMESIRRGHADIKRLLMNKIYHDWEAAQ